MTRLAVLIPALGLIDAPCVGLRLARAHGFDLPSLRAGRMPSSVYTSVFASEAMQILALRPAERGDTLR